MSLRFGQSLGSQSRRPALEKKNNDGSNRIFMLLESIFFFEGRSREFGRVHRSVFRLSCRKCSNRAGLIRSVGLNRPVTGAKLDRIKKESRMRLVGLQAWESRSAKRETIGTSRDPLPLLPYHVTASYWRCDFHGSSAYKKESCCCRSRWSMVAP